MGAPVEIDLMPRSSLTHRHVVVVSGIDLAAALRIAAEAATEFFGTPPALAAVEESGTFVPVPGLAGLYWCDSASHPALRRAVQGRMGRLARPVYFAWLDRDEALLDAARVRPDTGGRVATARARGRIGRRFTMDDIAADVRELFAQ